MKQLLSRIVAVALFFSAALGLSAGKYVYDTIPGDPLKAKIYTLPNGLKIFMDENHDRPRIQTLIPVKVGGKNDPAETTGLAHYFEHMMFKGTEKFGTRDYSAEKPLLDRIETLFETYRATTDSAQRAAIYHLIDSISYEASKYAIPNEYDKLMAAIGAMGTNAYTSEDVTCYTEDIPANVVELWAQVQSDRIAHPVLRGFHTELETIYEEKNMSLTRDSEKAYEKLFSFLFPNHPYGTQTVLGTQTHLKNPSITNIKNYHRTWYVPNNMAICLSGDFEPDSVVDIITRYFGDLEPNPSLPYIDVKPEAPITEPVIAEVVGLQAENLMMAWRTVPASHPDANVLSLVGKLLYNGTAGLIDTDINQRQLTLGCYAFAYPMADHGLFVLSGTPAEGQTLDEVRALLLGEVEKLCRGDFSDELLAAVKANVKRSMQQTLLDNNWRATMMADAFINGCQWADVVAAYNAADSITRDEVIEVARRYFTPESYVAVNKRQGTPTDEIKVAKPPITPIVMNRDESSDFLTEVRNTVLTPIEPRFVDFGRDLTVLTADGGIPVYYSFDDRNDLFSLSLVFETGTLADKMLAPASDYLPFLGTSTRSAAEIQAELYSLGCDVNLSIGSDRSYLHIYGLAENMGAAIDIAENWLADAQVDRDAYEQMVARLMKSREDAKSNQNTCFSRLRDYVAYGPDQAFRSLITPQEFSDTEPASLLASLRKMMNTEHRVIYSGPASAGQFLAEYNSHRRIPESFTKPVPVKRNQRLTTDETVFYVAPYDAKQLYMAQISNLEKPFNISWAPLATIYNEYFGGSMNAIVFQEMRERRSLAYSAWAYLYEPSRQNEPYYYVAQIATQNDKLFDAIDAFDDIIREMPQSPEAFGVAKEALKQRMRTDRTLRG